ncbi:LysR family transcriptional regulator [Clostridium pasteurianum DSM 525 = ATCC 6013]|uniref:LysR family transcriptional regulator n=1 Tax=Clostridium pasteurianum DSM 525 = ATCC 6013 TaxID=1262449 RepID=A0A0H3J983_CLOPA|nr:LysR family transcriptional regulator [Clostridium pasteurianum]AJA47675.1 LysR family transcriptional regulator [Clostridium pasteurianum DSM 525 = ATCC 6013]AJA51663.1 LysR family transcriptional regulator [Clostridium pasteurianum DSM 525 = ATCC 6013]AOZ74979.1 hypothetical protein AQ983_07730 [Clostridium pasteurianum DSM 525 = ATCC 6013]AOZ78774.1 hypothetical protein AQ984_07720 [Clostridium pasteurianum]ELP59578.1 LysR family transcriptional regulator [Clostridium pasteurianum DSM 52
MEIRVLRYFVAVAEEGNISNAAKILNITQPTLSRQIKDLENELGVELFARGNKQITLTEDGVLLHQRAMEIIELADKTASAFQEQKENVSGIISIGAVESNAVPYLMDILKEFSDKYPKVQFCIYSGYVDDIKDKIDKGLVDIGLLVEPVEISKYDSMKLPYEDRWGVIVPKNHEIAGKKAVTIKDIVKYPLIIPRRAMIGGEIKSWLDPYNGKMRVVAAYNLLSSATYFVSNGAGIAIALDGAMAVKENKENVFIAVEPKRNVSSVLVWKKNHIFTTSLTLLLKMIRQRYCVNEIF